MRKRETEREREREREREIFAAISICSDVIELLYSFVILTDSDILVARNRKHSIDEIRLMKQGNWCLIWRNTNSKLGLLTTKECKQVFD